MKFFCLLNRNSCIICRLEHNGEAFQSQDHLLDLSTAALQLKDCVSHPDGSISQLVWGARGLYCEGHSYAYAQERSKEWKEGENTA